MNENNITILGLPEILTLNILKKPDRDKESGSGTLSCSDNLEIPVTIDYPDEHGWMIKLPHGTTVTKELFEFACTGVEPLKNLLKVESFNNIFNTIKFNKFEIQFDHNQCGPTWIDLDIQLEESWNVISGLKIEKIGVEFYSIHVPAGDGLWLSTWGGSIYGTIKIENINMDITITLDEAEHLALTVEFKEGENYPSLASLAELAGFSGKTKELLDDIGLDKISLKNFTIGLDISEGISLSYVSVESELTVNDKIKFDASISLPDFCIMGRLAGESSIGIKDLIKDTPSEISNLDISDVLLYACPSKGMYSFDIKVERPYQIDRFSIEKVRLFLGCSGDKKSFSGKMDGIFTINFGENDSVDIFVKADYESGKGMKFIGATGPGQEIPIGELINSLIKSLDKPKAKVTLPKPLEGLIIKNLGICFDTERKDFKFTCESKFPVSDKYIDIIVAIDLIHKDGDYDNKFGGTITIGNAVFGLQFSEDHEETKFAAAWTQTDGQALGFDALAEALGLALPGIPSGLDLGLKAASFTYNKEDKTFEKTFVLTADSSNYGKAALVVFKKEEIWKFFFGLAVGKNINLSNLPVVNKMLDSQQTLAIEKIQVGIASEAINKALALDINTFIKDDYPKVPASGFDSNMALSMTLNLGGQLVPLSIGTGTSTTDSDVKGGLPKFPAPNESTIANTKVGTATGCKQGTVPVPKQAAADGTVWFNIQKSFGPVTFQKVGVKYKDNVLWFLMDSSISAAGLTISVMGLAVGSPLKDFEPQFNIEGLGIDYSNSALKICGSFLKMKPTPPVKLGFGGSVVIEAKTFGLEAVGAYIEIMGHDSSTHISMFVFAMVKGTFGGPPEFFVTGFSGGFGYNSQLRIPGQNEICDFPFIAGLTNPDVIGGKKPTPIETLEKLMGDGTTPAWVTPKVGSMWLAAGIQFTTYGLIQSRALLTAEFGRELKFALIGLSTVRFPKEDGLKLSPYAYFELQLMALFNPNEGVVSFSAMLSYNSFVIDKACKLTGGFAMVFWFGDNPHAGDFVLTLGGYSPYFSKPAWYPQVPRLGINWPIDSHTSITGEAYMALTPSALMAGGALNVQYHAGNLKAWFTAHADIIIWWNPLQFLANIAVSLGASYKVVVLGISKPYKVELGANLTLWGPPTGGTVTVHWWVVDITVRFGNGPVKLIKQQTWEQFATILPEANASSKFIIQKGLTTAPPQSTEAMLKAADKENDAAQVWLVRADDLLLSVDSPIPASDLWIGKNNNDESYHLKPDDKPGDKLNIKPMGRKGLSSSKRIYLERIDLKTRVEVDLLDQNQPWTIKAKTCNVPAALWGTGDNNRLSQGEQLIKDQLTGFTLNAPKPKLGPSPGVIDVADSLGYHLLTPEGAIPLVSGSIPSRPVVKTSTGTIQDIEQIMGAAATVRAQIYNALGALKLPQGKNNDLTKLATNARALFTDQPLLTSSNG